MQLRATESMGKRQDACGASELWNFLVDGRADGARRKLSLHDLSRQIAPRRSVCGVNDRRACLAGLPLTSGRRGSFRRRGPCSAGVFARDFHQPDETPPHATGTCRKQVCEKGTKKRRSCDCKFHRCHIAVMQRTTFERDALVIRSLLIFAWKRPTVTRRPPTDDGGYLYGHVKIIIRLVCKARACRRRRRRRRPRTRKEILVTNNGANSGPGMAFTQLPARARCGRRKRPARRRRLSVRSRRLEPRRRAC